MSDIERALASVRRIDNIVPIEGADMIECAWIGGWNVVVKKGEFQVGALVAYYEIDSWIPNSLAPFLSGDKEPREYKGIKGERLRTKKLRGVFSQGLILPLPEGHQDAPEGTNLTEVMGIIKWEKELPAALSGFAKSTFPTWLRRTDEPRCQNVVNEIFGYEPHRYHFDTSKLPEDAIAKLVADGVLVSTGENKYDKIYPAKASRDTEYEVTIKMDGSSMTVYHKDGQVGVCSRNLELKTSEENKDNAFVKMFFDSKLNEILPTMGNYAVQGELCGPGIQGNQESLKENNFFIFNVFNIDTQEYLSPDDRFYFVQELIRRDLNKNIAHHVPVLHDRVTLDGLGISNVQQLLAYADGPSLNAKLREGLVFKSYSYSGSFSFKAISNRWLSKNE